jgi:hypothetical protein
MLVALMSLLTWFQLVMKLCTRNSRPIEDSMLPALLWSFLYRDPWYLFCWWKHYGMKPFITVLQGVASDELSLHTCIFIKRFLHLTDVPVFCHTNCELGVLDFLLWTTILWVLLLSACTQQQNWLIRQCLGVNNIWKMKGINTFPVIKRESCKN